MCLFCRNEYTVEPLYQSLLPKCPWCGNLYCYRYEDVYMLAQCCDCGVLLNGPYIGVRFLLDNGLPDLSIGVSHGMCIECSEKKLLEWRIRKAARIAAVNF